MAKLTGNLSLKNNVAALGLFAVLIAPGVVSGQDSSLKGLIISNDGMTIVVRSPTGDTPVNLTPTTKIRDTRGALGVRGETHPPSDLIRGLPVDIDVLNAGGTVTATSITFKNSDLGTAKQISAGLDATDQKVAKNAADISTNASAIDANAENIAENSARLDDVGQLVAADRTKVFFDTGSTALPPHGKQDLMSIAAKAKSLPTAYRIAVVGRADPTGNAEANRRLSEQRAAAVRSYLIEHAGISPANFLPSTGLGDSAVVGDIDPPGSNAEARRVTVTIAVSKSARLDQAVSQSAPPGAGTAR